MYNYAEAMTKIQTWKDSYQNGIQVDWEIDDSIVQDSKCPYTNSVTKSEYTNCRFPIVSIQRQDIPKLELEYIPHVLIVAGFDGRDGLGISSTLNWVQDLIDDKNMLNWVKSKVKLTILPISNPDGFYDSKQYRDGSPDPLHDFATFRSDDKCLQGKTSRFINKLFKNSIFTTTLLMTSDKSGLNTETQNIGKHLSLIRSLLYCKF